MFDSGGCAGQVREFYPTKTSHVLQNSALARQEWLQPAPLEVRQLFDRLGEIRIQLIKLRHSGHLWTAGARWGLWMVATSINKPPKALHMG